MKLKALRSFYYRDIRRGRGSIAHTGDEFYLDGILDAEQISLLILDLRVTVVSDEVPENAEYKVCFHFNRVIDGETYSSDGKPTVYLRKKIACELMARGFVQPTDEMAWYPGKPLQAADLVTRTPKRMFNEPEKQNDPWIWRYKK